MGNDLRHLAAEDRDILLNKRLLAINRDPLGVWGLKVAELAGEDPDWGHFQVFVKPVTPIDPNGSGCPSFAVLYLSRRIIGREWPVSFTSGPKFTFNLFISIIQPKSRDSS